MSSSVSCSIFCTSCEVRKPSKKCTKGTRDKRGGLGDQGQVVRLLHRAGTSMAEAGLAHGHHVAVVAEDRQGVGGQRPGRDVEDGRGQLTGDLEHVGDHQQEALGRGEGRGQGAGLESTVNGARGTALALHLDDRRHDPPDVGTPWADHSSAHSPMVEEGVIG